MSKKNPRLHYCLDANTYKPWIESGKPPRTWDMRFDPRGITPRGECRFFPFADKAKGQPILHGPRASAVQPQVGRICVLFRPHPEMTSNWTIDVAPIAERDPFEVIPDELDMRDDAWYGGKEAKEQMMMPRYVYTPLASTSRMFPSPLHQEMYQRIEMQQNDKFRRSGHPIATPSSATIELMGNDVSCPCMNICDPSIAMLRAQADHYARLEAEHAIAVTRMARAQDTTLLVSDVLLSIFNALQAPASEQDLAGLRTAEARRRRGTANVEDCLQTDAAAERALGSKTDVIERAEHERVERCRLLKLDSSQEVLRRVDLMRAVYGFSTFAGLAYERHLSIIRLRILNCEVPERDPPGANPRPGSKATAGYRLVGEARKKKSNRIDPY